jgi:hypothetical protein
MRTLLTVVAVLTVALGSSSAWGQTSTPVGPSRPPMQSNSPSSSDVRPSTPPGAAASQPAAAPNYNDVALAIFWACDGPAKKTSDASGVLNGATVFDR